MSTMELSDLERIAETATDQFRLETLPTYLVPHAGRSTSRRWCGSFQQQPPCLSGLHSGMP
jgi:hypothetical protein